MLSHLAGTGRFPREAENSCPGSEQGDGTSWPGVAGGGGGGRNPHPPAPTVGDALAAAQPTARCSLQTGRKQTRAMFLQNYQLPAIPCSRPP